MSIEDGIIQEPNEAWTAARAERHAREHLIPGAKKDVLEKQGNTGDQATWDYLASRAGTERVKGYNPELESRLDALRSVAENLIRKIDATLGGHGSLLNVTGVTPDEVRALISGSNDIPQNKRSYYEALLLARQELEHAIGEIDMGIQPVLMRPENAILHPANTIPRMVATVKTALERIRG